MNRYYIYYTNHFEKVATVDADTMLDAILQFMKIHPDMKITKVTI